MTAIFKALDPAGDKSKGPLHVTIGQSKKRGYITIEFDKSITYLSMPYKQALVVAEAILEAAKSIKE